MAQLNEEFNIDTLPEGSSYDPLPPGWYTANITGADLKTTKSGTGQYIAVKYDITGPTHQGRVVFGNINIRNATPKAEEIGRQNLGELMRATGLARVTDTDQLLGHQVQIKLAVSQQDGYEPSNDVKGWRDEKGWKVKAIGDVASAPVAKASAPVQAQAAPAKAKAAPPWAKQS